MRLVSLNAWGGRLYDALSPWVRNVGADVLCLQEVTRALEPSPDWLIYRDDGLELSQRADLFVEISAHLPMHQSQFCPAARGLLMNAAGRGYASEHGIAVWVESRLAVTEQVQRFAHGSFAPNGWGLPPVSRSLHGLRLYDPGSGRCVVMVHLHGLRDPVGKGDTIERAAQAEAVMRVVQALRQPGDGVIVTGDLNLLPDSATFERWAEIGLTDLVTTHGYSDTRTSHYLKPQRFADYLLVTPEVRVVALDVPAVPEVSDHRPMILDFVL